MPIHPIDRIKPPALTALVCALGIVSTAQAQDFDGMSKEQRKQFLTAYAEVNAVDQILPVCNQLAPSYAAANEAIMAEFRASGSVDRARPLVDKFVSWVEGQNAAIGMALALSAGVTQKALRSELEENPDKCGEAFRIELFDTAFDGSAALVQAYGLEAPAADVVKAEPAAPASVTLGVEPPAAPPAMAAAVGMPPAIGDRVEELPGISWTMVDGVDNGAYGGAYCVWRCVTLAHDDGGDEPWLFIHEAVPLGADEAIDQMTALTDEYTVVEWEDVDPGALASNMAMQPDRLVMRKASVERHGSVHRHISFAIEKGGVTVIAELHYGDGDEGLPVAQEALSRVLLSLKVDQETVLAELAENPIAPTIESARGVPPAADQVIYAENPNPRSNALTLSLSYDDDARYLDKAVLETDGPTIEMNDSTYYYVPPQPDGAVIEGVFTSADGYAGVGISVLKSKTLAFNLNGRYTTSASSGVVGGFLASTGSSSEGEGSYRINGYTLELRSDDGSAQQDVFFPYMSRTFWPGSDGPSDEFNFINVGGKILYRDDE